MTRSNNAASLRGRKRAAADVAGEVTRRSTSTIAQQEGEQRAAAAAAAERRRQTTGHKFHIGQRVILLGRSFDGMINQDCEISRLLPPDNTSRSDRHYRVKGSSGQERMVKESQLTGRS